MRCSLKKTTNSCVDNGDMIHRCTAAAIKTKVSPGIGLELDRLTLFGERGEQNDGEGHGQMLSTCVPACNMYMMSNDLNFYFLQNVTCTMKQKNKIHL